MNFEEIYSEKNDTKKPSDKRVKGKGFGRKSEEISLRALNKSGILPYN